MNMPVISINEIIRFDRQNFSFKTENKFCYVLVCRISGESLFFYNNQTRLVKRGEILYIPTGANYSQKCDEETLICFHLSVSGRISNRIEVFTPKNADKICELFIKAERLWRLKPANYEFLCMSVLYEIIANTEICSIEKEKNSLLDPAMQYLMNVVYETDFSLDEMCRHSNISRTYLNLLFRQTYQCTPTAYVNKIRIERAKQLIITGNFTNEEISKICGFNDVKYFYVIFKRVTGFTTKEYKRDFERAQLSAQPK